MSLTKLSLDGNNLIMGTGEWQNFFYSVSASELFTETSPFSEELMKKEV
jgi:hypothetical protein